MAIMEFFLQNQKLSYIKEEDKDQESIQSNATTKVSKGAKTRNRYNQVPHLTQDTNGKVTNSQ